MKKYAFFVAKDRQAGAFEVLKGYIEKLEPSIDIKRLRYALTKPFKELSILNYKKLFSQKIPYMKCLRFH